MPSVRFFNPLGGAAYREGGGPLDHARRPLGNWHSDVAWDLIVPTRTRCFAPFDAEVVRVGSLGTSGVTAGIRIGLDNRQGLAAFLHHLVREEVSLGQRVRAGQLIGFTGIAANVPHLHFAMGRSYDEDRVSNGIDPTPFLRTTEGMTTAVTMRLDRGSPTADLPFAGSLRLVMAGRTLRGWEECRQAIMDLATDKTPAVDPCALSWRGRIFRGSNDVTNVCRNLAGRFLGLEALARDLSLGSRGEAVLHAERWLRRHGFDPGPADGIFDMATREAVIAFQRAKNLDDDGIIGRKTWRALRR